LTPAGQYTVFPNTENDSSPTSAMAQANNTVK
jgi:hypothetical protein